MLEDAELYLLIVNHISDGVYFVNTQRRIIFWNHAAETITGYSSEEMLGTSCQDSLLAQTDRDGRPLCQIACPLYETILDGLPRQNQVLIRHKSGNRIPVRIHVYPVKKEDEIVGAIEIFTQNSPNVYEDDLIEHLSGIAMHDGLTQLPNRRYLESFLDFKISDAMRFNRMVAVLFADIDDFSQFNNDHGHDLGDAILIHVAETLQQITRKNDLIGRWGGEEFVGIYSIASAEDALVLGERFRAAIEQAAVTHNGISHHATVSVGITVIKSTDTPESILQRADAYMYRSKERGKNSVTSD